jgi:hypothetical protein
LFGDAASDLLGAAARAKALQRCARSDRPFARFLATLFSGRSEDAALAEVGISRRDLLDAATETERARATKTIAEDPTVSALRAARAALAEGAIDRADAALAAAASTLADAGNDPWIAADARLCLAQIARARGDEKSATASLAAATESGKIVRVREARIVETWLAARRGDTSGVWSELVRDFPDLTSEQAFAVLDVPAAVAATFPGLAADAASLDATRRVVAARRAVESGAKELAALVRLLASDPDEAVRSEAAPRSRSQ